MKTKYSITGLDCPNCAAKLASLIEKDSQIQSCRINFLAEKITVESELDEQTLLVTLNKVAASFDKSVRIAK